MGSSTPKPGLRVEGFRVSPIGEGGRDSQRREAKSTMVIIKQGTSREPDLATKTSGLGCGDARVTFKRYELALEPQACS